MRLFAVNAPETPVPPEVPDPEAVTIPFGWTVPVPRVRA